MTKMMIMVMMMMTVMMMILASDIGDIKLSGKNIYYLHASTFLQTTL